MIYISLGDPYSCNIELTHQALHKVRPEQPVILVGSYWQWCDQLQRLGTDVTMELRLITEQAQIQGPGLHFLDVGSADNMIAEKMSDAMRGQLAYRSLEVACEWIASDSHRSSLLTCPVDKKVMSTAGFGAHGHTEYLAEKFARATIMILAGPELRVALVSNHLAIKDVAASINEELIVEKGQLLVATMQQQFGLKMPRIAVTGLNPHCSDSGLFGDEEQRIIAPSIAKLQSFVDAEISGPHPADTVFYRAMQGKYDCVLAMYHDQGLGPLKTVHFDTAINVTGGLPFKRVSPDHGPATDLFLQKKASIRSFVNALRFLSQVN